MKKRGSSKSPMKASMHLCVTAFGKPTCTQYEFLCLRENIFANGENDSASRRPVGHAGSIAIRPDQDDRDRQKSPSNSTMISLKRAEPVTANRNKKIRSGLAKMAIKSTRVIAGDCHASTLMLGPENPEQRTRSDVPTRYV